MHDWLTSELVVAALFVTSFTTVGLLALWAAASRWHWFLRAGVLIAALSPLLVVPAYEPLLIFALEAAMIVAGVKLWQWHAYSPAVSAGRTAANPDRNGRAIYDHGRSPLRFSLKSLLLVTPIVAVISAVGTHMAARIGQQPIESWTTILLDGFAAGVCVLLVAWMAVSLRRRIVWLIATVLCLGLAEVLNRYDWLHLTLTQSTDVGWPPDAQRVASMLGTSWPYPQVAWLYILPAVMLLVLLVIALGHRTFTPVGTRTNSPHSPRRSTSRPAVATILIMAIIAAFPVYVLWRLLNPPPPPSFPTPNPNGFDLIVTAAREFDSSPILTTRVPAQSVAQLAAEVAKYSSSYEKLRLGLAQDIRARQWPRQDESWSTSRWPDSVQGVMRQVARPLSVEAELAYQQQRYSDTARIARDIVRWSHAASRDGILWDYLLGIAQTSVAGQGLYPAIEHLDADECRVTLNLLTELERAREPLQDAMARDRVWNQNALGWHGHVWQILEDIAPRAEARAAVYKTLRRIQAVEQLLMIELSLRIYRLEYGALPNSLADLKPELPEEMLNDPLDPAGGEFRYVRAGDSYVLYSVGIDGQDNQGRAAGRNAGISNDGQDLRLDVFLAPQTPPLPATATSNAVIDAGPVEDADVNKK